MKLVRKRIDKDRSGTVELYPEELEDMWHVYNLISVGDSLKATTIRRVQNESSTGSVESQRIRLTLTITVEDIDFDPQGGLLRIRGRNMVENKYVKMGMYHTIDLELNRNFTLFKSEWDIIALERIEEACDITKQADVAAVVLQEGHKHSLQEVLQDSAVQSQLTDTKFAREIVALDKFFKMLNEDPDRAFYGWDHVRKAEERGAIGTLLLSDGLFRSADIPTRRKYIRLVESVRSSGGKVLIFSSLHVSGEPTNNSNVKGLYEFFQGGIHDPNPLPDVKDMITVIYEYAIREDPKLFGLEEAPEPHKGYKEESNEMPLNKKRNSLFMESLRHIDHTYIKKHTNEQDLRPAYTPALERYEYNINYWNEMKQYLIHTLNQIKVTMILYLLSLIPFIGVLVYPIASAYALVNSLGYKQAIVVGILMYITPGTKPFAMVFLERNYWNLILEELNLIKKLKGNGLGKEKE
ncbi:7651_t:CDS:10, partial [Racocetra fulgida]